MEHRDFTHLVPSELQTRERLSRYAIGIFPFLETGSAVKKALKKSQIIINGRVGGSGDWVVGGDVLNYKVTFIKPKAIDPKLSTVYVDDFLIIVNKPPGLLSSGDSAQSLQSILKSYPASKEPGSLFYPYLVHRLDRQTSGLIIAARTIDARRRLGTMVEKHEIIKEYALLSEGDFPSETRFITNMIDGKSAKTEILTSRQLHTKDSTSYLRVRLHTGRTHQIRRHLLAIGHPIIGDDIYNPNGVSFGRGLFLMADYLRFEHPILKRTIEVNLDLHKKFLKYI